MTWTFIITFLLGIGVGVLLTDSVCPAPPKTEVKVVRVEDLPKIKLECPILSGLVPGTMEVK